MFPNETESSDALICTSCVTRLEEIKMFKEQVVQAVRTLEASRLIQTRKGKGGYLFVNRRKSTEYTEKHMSTFIAEEENIVESYCVENGDGIIFADNSLNGENVYVVEDGNFFMDDDNIEEDKYDAAHLDISVFPNEDDTLMTNTSDFAAICNQDSNDTSESKFSITPIEYAKSAVCADLITTEKSVIPDKTTNITQLNVKSICKFSKIVKFEDVAPKCKEFSTDVTHKCEEFSTEFSIPSSPHETVILANNSNKFGDISRNQEASSIDDSGINDSETLQREIYLPKFESGSISSDFFQEIIIDDTIINRDTLEKKVINASIEESSNLNLPNIHESEISVFPEKRITVKKKNRPRQTDNNKIMYTVNSNLKCDYCDKVSPNLKMYHNHMNSHFPNHTCSVCGKGFPTQKRLKRHASSHQKGLYECNFCHKIFTKYNTMNSHKQRKHSEVKLHKCTMCDERFPTYNRRMLHLANVHGQNERKYVCHICSKQFLVSGSLSAHFRRIHGGQKKHRCPDCGVGFFLLQELVEHALVHSRAGDYPCALCHERFTCKRHLIVHMKTHPVDEKYECDICGKKFKQSLSLQYHKKIHEESVGAVPRIAK